MPPMPPSVPVAGRPKETEPPARGASLAVKHVLCATDFSHAAAAALEFGVIFARACKAEIGVVHVRPGLVPAAAGMPHVPGVDGKSPREPIESLDRCAQRAIACGLATWSVLLHGDPAGEIVRAAGEAAADLIVMGRHSRDAPAGIVGSVTERVIKEASCPVMVARSFPSPQGGTPRHVLCAVDLGQTAATTLGYAVAVANALEGDLLVLDVAAPERVPAARKALAALVAKAPVASRGLRQSVVTGAPYQQILAAARESRSDLVVIGSHAGGFADRPFLGSTTLRLLRESECPVLVVPVGVSRRREQASRQEFRSALDMKERPDVATRLRSCEGRPERRRPSGWWGR